MSIYITHPKNLIFHGIAMLWKCYMVGHNVIEMLHGWSQSSMRACVTGMLYECYKAFYRVVFLIHWSTRSFDYRTRSFTYLTFSLVMILVYAMSTHDAYGTNHRLMMHSLH